MPQIYHDRSPINNAEHITSPLLVLQGGQDRVVPQAQAEMIVESVKKRGTRCEYFLSVARTCSCADPAASPRRVMGPCPRRWRHADQRRFRQAANMRASIGGQMDFFNDVFGIKRD